MESFQSLVVSVGGVLLVIFLIFIAISLYRQKGSTAYPPVLASCPDYWQDLSMTGTKGGSNCVNVKNLGLNTGMCANKTDFSLMTLCEKSKWAAECNITWDGLTDNENICQTTLFPALAK